MKESQAALCALMKGLCTGQAGLRECLNNTMEPGMRSQLQCQLREYGSIESEARAIACQRGWEPAEPDPVVRLLAAADVRRRLGRKSAQSHMAGVLILRCTDNLIRALQALHRLPHADHKLETLFQKLLDCENASIRQLQRFL